MYQLVSIDIKIFRSPSQIETTSGTKLTPLILHEHCHGLLRYNGHYKQVHDSNK